MRREMSSSCKYSTSPRPRKCLPLNMSSACALIRQSTMQITPRRHGEHGEEKRIDEPRRHEVTKRFSVFQSRFVFSWLRGLIGFLRVSVVNMCLDLKISTTKKVLHQL